MFYLLEAYPADITAESLIINFLFFGGSFIIYYYRKKYTLVSLLLYFNVYTDYFFNVSTE